MCGGVRNLHVERQPDTRTSSGKFLAEDFSIANGEITPTMKVRRRQVETRYAKEIEKMYRE